MKNMSDDDEKKFLTLMAQGLSAQAWALETDRGAPSMPALAKALAISAGRVDAASVEKSLSYYVGSGEKMNRYQVYSSPTWHGQQGWSYGGQSAWVPLMESGKGPEDPAFARCAKALAAAGIALDAPLSASGDASEVRLLSHLAIRGWLDFARGLEASAGSSMGPNKGEPSPLAWALRGGHGPMAHWLLGKGASPMDNAVALAAEGLIKPARPRQGAWREAAWEERSLGLRLGARISGLARVDAMAWTTVLADPLASAGSLMCWLMVQGARAQAVALGQESRVAAAAPLIAKAQDKDWEQIQAKAAKAESGGGALKMFSFLAKARAAGEVDPRVAARDEILGKAREAVKERDLACASIGPALALVDKGMFEEAGGALGRLPALERLDACVALLGLAKAGYWDMPMPSSGFVDPQERHPLRWAGFKLALEKCGDAKNAPIHSLSGATLAGVCATLGFEDALGALVEAGASLDPHPLMEGPSPLSLAMRNGQARVAVALLGAGASPLEGAKKGMFGYPSKDWAVHLAFDARDERLLSAMLEADGRCAMLPDPSGKTLFERASALAGSAADEAGKAFAARVEAMAQRCEIAEASSPAHLSQDSARPAARPRAL